MMKELSRLDFMKIGLGLVFGLLFFVPDVVYSLIDARFPLCLNPEKFLLICLAGFIVSLPADKKIVYVFLGLWASMQLTQFSCMVYFGTYLSPFAVELTFKETSDIMEEVVHIIGRFWYMPFVIFTPYLIYAFLIAKYNEKRFCFKYGWVAFIAFFAVFMIRANTSSGAHQMLFKRTCYASFNTVNAYTGYFGNILPRFLLKDKKESNEFLPYQVTKTMNDAPVTIFVVYGESVNRHRMSLFGYERDTTPKMKQRQKTEDNFVALPAYSAAVNTLISIPTFLNLQREPTNFRKQIIRDTYLPRLASENGFKTIYIGFQGESVRQKSALSHVDDYLIYEPGADINEEKYFFDAMQKIDFSKKTFVFLNKRNLHTPFYRNYDWDKEKYDVFKSEGVDEKTYRSNTYDNAMLYEDSLLDKMMTYLKEHVQTPVYFYYIGDHGEAFGQNNIWGHGALISSVYHVPFIFNAFHIPDSDKAYVEKIKSKQYSTAYDVGLLIAEKMGYAIDNPNQTSETFFINGTDLMGRAGYVQIEKKDGSITETLIQKVF